MHGRNGRDTHRLRCLAYIPAGKTIAAGIERGSCYHHIGLDRFERLSYGGQCCIPLLAEIVVSADEGRDHCALVTEYLLQQPSRPYRAIPYFNGNARSLFAPDASEKLV